MYPIKGRQAPSNPEEMSYTPSPSWPPNMWTCLPGTKPADPSKLERAAGLSQINVFSLDSLSVFLGILRLKVQQGCRESCFLLHCLSSRFSRCRDSKAYLLLRGKIDCAEMR